MWFFFFQGTVVEDNIRMLEIFLMSSTMAIMDIVSDKHVLGDTKIIGVISVMSVMNIMAIMATIAVIEVMGS
jgi:hypothetical protein